MENNSKWICRITTPVVPKNQDIYWTPCLMMALCRSVYYFYAPNVFSKTTSYTNNYLLQILLFMFLLIEEGCYSGHGKDYEGKVDRTKTGRKCLPWSTKIQDQLEKYPELKGHNYCRNPGGQEDQPWCYTDDELKPVEICDIPKCGLFLFPLERLLSRSWESRNEINATTDSISNLLNKTYR